VLYGGRSGEREISLKTGAAVLKGFKALGMDAVGIDAGRDLPQVLVKKKIGFCFIALHGRWGEDGTVQGLLEMMEIPYSGSRVASSAVSMNKGLCKRIFENAKIPTAPFEVVDSARTSFHPPCVVKPIDSGSALGVSVVKEQAELEKAVRGALRHSESAVVEKYIRGTEITVPILGEKTLPIIEIVPKTSFYDFRAKYTPGMSDHILPARLSERCAEEARETSLRVHKILGCRAFSRVDLIIDEKSRPWVLELNSIPGMTETSLFPEAARAAGLSFPAMLLQIVRFSIQP
jgi:D-alanine-D-alanine ligase